MLKTKKILLVIIFSILITPLYAGPKDKVRDGFISKKNVHPVKNDFNINDPKNKIILIDFLQKTSKQLNFAITYQISEIQETDLIEEKIKSLIIRLIKNS